MKKYAVRVNVTAVYMGCIEADTPQQARQLAEEQICTDQWIELPNSEEWDVAHINEWSVEDDYEFNPLR